MSASFFSPSPCNCMFSQHFKEDQLWMNFPELLFCRNFFGYVTRRCTSVWIIGVQGVAFDRLELDAFAEEYKKRNERPASEKEKCVWDVKERAVRRQAPRDQSKGQPGCTSEVTSGTSKNVSGASSFERALERATFRKPNWYWQSVSMRFAVIFAWCLATRTEIFLRVDGKRRQQWIVRTLRE